MSQDMVWYEVYEALDNDECPICKLVKKVADRFIDGFLYENVNDPKLRVQLRKSKGFCNAHAWLLHSYGEPLAHAIIYEPLLKDTLAEFNSTFLIQAKKKINIIDNKENKNECILCELENTYEKSYLKIIDENVSDNIDFKKKFIDDGILCVPHMRQYIALSTNTKSLEIVQEVIKTKYQYLINCLSEIRRKNDYRFSDEQWTADERNAWTKAVKIMAGRKMYEK